jgi:hypothetical protein
MHLLFCVLLLLMKPVNALKKAGGSYHPSS